MCKIIFLTFPRFLRPILAIISTKADRGRDLHLHKFIFITVSANLHKLELKFALKFNKVPRVGKIYYGLEYVFYRYRHRWGVIKGRRYGRTRRILRAIFAAKRL